MTWISWHSQSEVYATEAHAMLRKGDRAAALQLFGKAAHAETEALRALDTSKRRTLGITAVSAVALWFKADIYEKAEAIAFEFLAMRLLPDFAVVELRNLLQSIWLASSKQSAGVTFLPGQVLVSVKGPKTILGGAPLDLIVEKVQIIQSIFYRTVEYVRDVPHRGRGQPSFDVKEACRPWILQAPPGSYQFSVAIQEQIQKDLFKDTGPSADHIAEKFMSILKAIVDDPIDDLPKIVQSEDYRKTFLKLTRNLAPTGKNFSLIEITGPNENISVPLLPENRTIINSVIREISSQSEPSQKPIVLQGILRALHLEQDWLEITVDGIQRRIDGLPDAVDDVIGPMVNREVVVHAVEGTRGRVKFVDIESLE